MLPAAAIVAVLALALPRREDDPLGGERLRARAERRLLDRTGLRDQLFIAFLVDREHAAALAAASRAGTDGRYDAEAYHLAMEQALADHAELGRPAPRAALLNEFAWWMLEQAPERCRDAEHALTIATRAVERAAGRPPAERATYLDTLAMARFRTGDRAGAIAAQTSALALLSPEDQDLRDELSRRLARFEAAEGH